MLPNSPSEPPRRLVVDHELLARLGPDSPREEWEPALRRAGLWDLDGLPGEPGRALERLRQVVRAWPAQLHEERPALAAWLEPGSVFLWLGAAVVLFVGQALFGWIAGVGLSAALVMAGIITSQRSGGPSEAHAARAAQCLRQLTQHSFVESVGERVVEHLPHREYLMLRLDDVDAALNSLATHEAELQGTIVATRAANARLGREVDDAEVARLLDALAAVPATRARLETGRNSLAARLRRYDASLELLRASAERDALSQRTARLIDDARGEAPLREAASIEVDVVEVEAELANLHLESKARAERLAGLLGRLQGGR